MITIDESKYRYIGSVGHRYLMGVDEEEVYVYWHYFSNLQSEYKGDLSLLMCSKCKYDRLNKEAIMFDSDHALISMSQSEMDFEILKLSVEPLIED